VFLCQYIIEQGPDFIKQQRKVLQETYVHSPTLGRMVNVGWFLRNKETLLLRQVQGEECEAFTEDHMTLLRKVGIREDFRARSNVLSHYDRFHRYKAEGGDVNALEKTETLVEVDGRLVVEQCVIPKYKPDDEENETMLDGRWMYQHIMRKRAGKELSPGLLSLLDDLNVNWDREYKDMRQFLPGVTPPDTEKNHHFKLLREYSQDGNDINTLRGTDHPVKVGDRLWNVITMDTGSAGQWLQGNRSNRNKTEGYMSDQREQLLESIGINWDRDPETLSKGCAADKDVVDDPRYQLLCEFHAWGGDINIGTGRDLVKTLEGEWEVVKVKKKEKNRSIGAWVESQKYNEQKGKLSAIRKKRFDDLGIIWKIAN
jgi:hypothetical protein